MEKRIRRMIEIFEGAPLQWIGPSRIPRIQTLGAYAAKRKAGRAIAQ